MRTCSMVCAASILLQASEAPAAMGYFRLGVSGNGWASALSSDPGVYLELPRSGQERLVRVRTPRTYTTWRETLATFVDSVDGGWMRPAFVPETLNLALEGVRQRVPVGQRNLALSGICWASVDRLLPMFDGDPSTATVFRISAPANVAAQTTLAQSVLVNLGADYPVERVRFYPRLGTESGDTRGLVEAMRPPQIELDLLGEADFTGNRLPWFELSAASAAAGLPSDCSQVGPDRPWLQKIGREVVNTTGDPRLTVLAHELDGKSPVIDISFASRPLQWIGLRPLDALKDYEVAELEVYGHGHVPRSVYTTTVLDLGQPLLLGRLRWSGEQPAGTHVEIRTRSGYDPDPLRYWVIESTVDDYVEVSRETFLRAPDASRKTTDDHERWSTWSPAYRWEDGVDDSEALTAPWDAGAAIVSPSPARYVQLRVVFHSQPNVGPRLRNLDLELASPVARDVVAEIWPRSVPRGVRTTFTFSAAADLVDGDAFDRLEIFTLVRADSVRAVTVDGAPVSPNSAQIQADRIVIELPRLADGRDTDKLITVEFDARVVQFGTEFLAWVYDGGEEGARQLARAGDANEDYPGDALGVETDGLGRSPLSRVRIRPNPFTPNGDGLNDEALVVFDVYDVTATRPLRVSIHDLSGHRIRDLEELRVRRGVYENSMAPRWDGKDDAGRRVPPGIYLCRVGFVGDRRETVQVRTVSLAY